MTMKSICSAAVAVVAAFVMAAGADQAAARPAAAANDYSAFRTENPHSILIVPVLNNTVNVRAPEFFLSTVSEPFANRGYYVFPAHMVQRVLEEDGLADPGLVHSADPRRLNNLFGCDAVLYITIQKWESKYLVLATQTSVKFDYSLKSCKTGDVLWQHTEERVYVPQSSSSGNIYAQLAAQMITAAMEKGMPNYMPLTSAANASAAAWPGQGIPAGPYLPELYEKDVAVFPAHTAPTAGGAPATSSK